MGIISIAKDFFEEEMMNNTVNRKIKIGISACAYGAKTRYNRKGWVTKLLQQI